MTTYLHADATVYSDVTWHGRIYPQIKHINGVASGKPASSDPLMVMMD